MLTPLKRHTPQACLEKRVNNITKKLDDLEENRSLCNNHSMTKGSWNQSRSEQKSPLYHNFVGLCETSQLPSALWRGTRHTHTEVPSIQTGPTRKRRRLHQWSGSAVGRVESDIATTHNTPGPWLKEFNMPGNQTRFSYPTNAKREDKDRQYLTTTPSSHPWQNEYTQNASRPAGTINWVSPCTIC